MKVAVQKKKCWWLVPLMAVVLIYAAITFAAQSNNLYEINLEIKQLEEKIAREEEVKQELLKMRDEISSDESIEKIAREKLGMVKDGERVFVDINK
ncbi:MAG TPA: septum formation initiator family protein [Clostridiaceae bacterium]|nr:septum formation initiator family protein [Clostridiaceae bacterium]